MKTEPLGDVALMRCTFAAPSYGADTAAYHRLRRSVAKWIAANCLPYRTVEMRTFRAMVKSLDPKCPEFGRKALTAHVRHRPWYCFFHISFIFYFFISMIKQH